MIRNKKQRCKNWVASLWCKRGILNYILLPFSIIYYICHLINYHIIQRPKAVKPFVICVGNAVAGGTGKTPFAIALGKKLIALGYQVAFLSRGYESLAQETEYAVMVSDKMTAEQVGDEALLLSQHAPTYICKNRFKAALYAQEEGANVVIMDDGMQNNTIHKDFSFLLIDAKNPCGNGFMIPAGPLREPISTAKKRANCIAYINSTSDQHGALSVSIRTNSKPLKDKNYLAFSSIGNPSRFHMLLKQNEFDVKLIKIFPDHHLYTHKEIENLIKTASKKKLKLITTQKDAVKIHPKLLSKIQIFDIEHQFEVPQPLLSALQHKHVHTHKTKKL